MSVCGTVSLQCVGGVTKERMLRGSEVPLRWA